jgi:putative ABC transport system permease protein
MTTDPALITWLDLGLAVPLVLIAVALSAWQRLGLGRGVVLGAIRASVQLILVGHILLWLFAADRWYLVVAVMLIMSAVAAYTAAGRQTRNAATLRQLRTICGVSILAGSAFTIVYVTAVIVPVTPWYNPRYLIPLFGMIVSNAMNGAALAAERLHAEMESSRPEIESYLALGAAASQASAEPTRRAIIAAMIPAVNSLAVVGIVSLPGMMTGQILAGADPTLAVRYQLVVAFMLVGATAITAAGVVLWYRRSFFSSDEQLLPRVPV